MTIQQAVFANHDWRKTISAGVEMAEERLRKGVELTEQHVMWALLKDAAIVSRRAYRAPPQTGFPGKSAMPDAPDEVTYWQKVTAMLQGTLSDEDVRTESTPPIPSAEQISRAEVVLDVWHYNCLTRKGDKARIKKAVYLKACGVADKRICSTTGLSRYQINRAKEEAMQDMWEVIRRY